MPEVSLTENRARGRPDEPQRYEIRLEGHLHPRWSARMDGMSIDHQDDGSTVLRGVLPDQPALHGLLGRIRDLGLPIISVQRIAGTLEDHG